MPRRIITYTVNSVTRRRGMEEKSVRRLGISKPKKGVKVIDLAARRLGPKKPENKRVGKMGMVL